jgi:hypothetical protein
MVPTSFLWKTGLAQLFVWHHAPGGEFFGGAGRRAASGIGRLLGHTDPRIPGAGFGSLENVVEQGDAQSSSATTD